MANRIEFLDMQHRHFYHEMLERSGKSDTYHKALFYTLGLTDDTRQHINDLYDFVEKGINPEGLDAGWQTCGSHKLTLLAFNLFNGFTEDGREHLSTPYELFDSSFASYMVQAIRIRYPGSFREPVDLDTLTR